MTTSVKSFFSLENSLIQKVFVYLTPNELEICHLVCKVFYGALSLNKEIRSNLISYRIQQLYPIAPDHWETAKLLSEIGRHEEAYELTNATGLKAYSIGPLFSIAHRYVRWLCSIGNEKKAKEIALNNHFDKESKEILWFTISDFYTHQREYEKSKDVIESLPTENQANDRYRSSNRAITQLVEKKIKDEGISGDIEREVIETASSLEEQQQMAIFLQSAKSYVDKGKVISGAQTIRFHIKRLEMKRHAFFEFFTYALDKGYCFDVEKVIENHTYSSLLEKDQKKYQKLKFQLVLAFFEEFSKSSHREALERSKKWIASWQLGFSPGDLHFRTESFTALETIYKKLKCTTEIFDLLEKLHVFLYYRRGFSDERYCTEIVKLLEALSTNADEKTYNQIVQKWDSFPRMPVLMLYLARIYANRGLLDKIQSLLINLEDKCDKVDFLEYAEKIMVCLNEKGFVEETLTLWAELKPQFTCQSCFYLEIKLGLTSIARETAQAMIEDECSWGRAMEKVSFQFIEEGSFYDARETVSVTQEGFTRKREISYALAKALSKVNSEVHKQIATLKGATLEEVAAKSLALKAKYFKLKTPWLERFRSKEKRV